ncbi:hypothetical protein B0H19DRAFT_1076827 [Mycena capillaripes]|nr:hypothetical protein B0H19DRAFT_1076827 [Mycena capillaripes]
MKSLETQQRLGIDQGKMGSKNAQNPGPAESGSGQGLRCAERFVSIEGKAVSVPTLTVAEFCQQYNLSDRILALLNQEGFENAAALLEVSEATLKDVGFKDGQIAELKRALRESLATEMVPVCLRSWTWAGYSEEVKFKRIPR